MTPIEKLKALIAAEPFNGKQVDFARAINRSPAQVNQWLSGYRKFDLKGQQIIENELKLHGYFGGHAKMPDGNVVALPERVDPITAQVIAMLGFSWRAKINARHFGHVTASSFITQVARFMSMARGFGKHSADTLPCALILSPRCRIRVGGSGGHSNSIIVVFLCMVV